MLHMNRKEIALLSFVFLCNCSSKKSGQMGILSFLSLNGEKVGKVGTFLAITVAPKVVSSFSFCHQLPPGWLSYFHCISTVVGRATIYCSFYVRTFPARLNMLSKVLCKCNLYLFTELFKLVLSHLGSLSFRR